MASGYRPLDQAIHQLLYAGAVQGISAVPLLAGLGLVACTIRS
jgi:hypothetical protein